MTLVVQNETVSDLGILILAAGTFVLALAVLVIRYASFHYPSGKGDNLARGRIGWPPSLEAKGPRPVLSSCSSREQINWRRVVKIQMDLRPPFDWPDW